MVVICYYSGKEIHKVLKFHVNNSSYFEISVSLFLAQPSNKRCTSIFQN